MFRLSFLDENDKDISDGSVSYVSVMDGTIYYYRYDAAILLILKIYMKKPMKRLLRLYRTKGVLRYRKLRLEI